jgi:hypothetical protein
MTAMQFDFSALDAELDRLGPPAEDALTLAQRYAPPELAAGALGRPLPLDQIDRALAALESDGEPLPPVALQREPVPFAPSFTPPAPVNAPAEYREAQERRSEPPQAFASTFPSEPPAAIAAGFPSEPPPAIAAGFPSAPPAPLYAVDFPSEPPPPVEAAPALQSEPPTLRDPREPEHTEEPDAHAAPRAARGATLTQSQEIVLPDPVREELATESGELRLDGDEPSSGSFELPESATAPRITAPGRGASAFTDRDPDAEFDALLSEATDPRGIPTGARIASSGEVDTDDLLRGLEGDELADEELSAQELAAAHADEPHEADLLTRSLFEDAGESTEITDRSALVNAVAAAKTAEADITLADELDADDLEIVMEEDEDGATLAPPAGPQSSKAPPPPPPPGADKRPSLLGRIFNKREPGNE